MKSRCWICVVFILLAPVAWAGKWVFRPEAEVLHERLGVSARAGREEIQAAYRQAALEFHPDLQPQANPEAEALARWKFNRISEAYHKLYQASPAGGSVDSIPGNHLSSPSNEGSRFSKTPRPPIPPPIWNEQGWREKYFPHSNRDFAEAVRAWVETQNTVANWDSFHEGVLSRFFLYVSENSTRCRGFAACYFKLLDEYLTWGEYRDFGFGVARPQIWDRGLAVAILAERTELLQFSDLPKPKLVDLVDQPRSSVYGFFIALLPALERSPLDCLNGRQGQKFVRYLTSMVLPEMLSEENREEWGDPEDNGPEATTFRFFERLGDLVTPYLSKNRLRSCPEKLLGPVRKVGLRKWEGGSEL